MPSNGKVKTGLRSSWCMCQQKIANMPNHFVLMLRIQNIYPVGSARIDMKLFGGRLDSGEHMLGILNEIISLAVEKEEGHSDAAQFLIADLYIAIRNWR